MLIRPMELLGTFLTALLALPACHAAIPLTSDKDSERVTACLLPPVLIQGEARECKTLAARMAELNVPGVSIAVIHNGAVIWAKGFGIQGPTRRPVDQSTLFQAGSISKPLAALAALHLVQEGKISLDADINKALRSWQIPSSPAASDEVVTLRELLSHTAGISVHGFPGYKPGTAVPSLVEVLDGTPPANTEAIRILKRPGSEWNYSGGGFTIMQQALIDVTHKPFPKLMRTTVLTPLGMTRSTYLQPLPSAFSPNAAVPYGPGGKPIEGGAHTYPELAAAGLWTTPSDLARYILDVQNSLAGKTSHVLNSTLTREMLTPGKNHWGLGIEIGGAGEHRYLTHGGVNEGFQSLFVGYEKADGDGAVVMTNAVGGTALATEVIRSVADVYDWPDFKPAVRTATKMEHDALQRYAGTYAATPTFSVVYTLEGDQLFAQATGQGKFPIYPEGPSKFFMKVVDAEIDFHMKDDGQVDYLTLHQGGHDYKEMKK